MGMYQIIGSASDSAAARTAKLKKSPAGVWNLHWSEPQADGTWRSKSLSTRTKSRAEAQTALERFKRQDQIIQTQSLMDRYTVAEIIDFYVTHHASTKGETASRSLIPITQHLGKLMPSEITPVTLSAYFQVRRQTRPVKDGTLRRELGCLVAALNYSKKHKRLTSVPEIDLPPQSRARVVYMTPEQAQHLWDSAMDWEGFKGSGRRVKLFTALALDTAARKEAIEELTWDRVDFRLRLVDYKVPGRPDTNKRRVPIPMSDRLYDLLKWASEDQHPKAHVIGTGSIRKAWATFTEEIGMAWVTPHVCRHTWATTKFDEGYSLPKIAAFLGDTEETVSRNYIHVHVDHLRDMVNHKGATR